MRFDKYCQFITEGTDTYNAETGNYNSAEPSVTEAWGDLTNSGERTSKIVYGDVKQGGAVLRSPVHSEANKVRIDGKMYHIDFRRKLRRVTVYLVRES